MASTLFASTISCYACKCPDKRTASTPTFYIEFHLSLLGLDFYTRILCCKVHSSGSSLWAGLGSSLQPPLGDMIGNKQRIIVNSPLLIAQSGWIKRRKKYFEMGLIRFCRALIKFMFEPKTQDSDCGNHSHDR